MAKKKSKAIKKKLLEAWCWYCERTFEDDKVLLQHQKARHFKCSHCPRRLNTAGGLAVHIDQVHKLPTDKITNALPGRDTFDVEIYGMVGVPAADLEAWKRRRAEELGQTLETTKVKRPKINKGVIPIEELKKQLATHKALMSGVAAPATADILLPNDLNNASQPYPVSPFPPPGFTPGMPPMGYPQPGMPGMPGQPGFLAPPAGLPPPPPGMPIPPGFPMPPPGFFANLPPPPPGMPLLPGMMPPPGAVPSPAAALPPPVPAAAQPPSAQPAASTAAAPAATPVPDSSVLLKAGQRCLYADNDVSVEEKRALQPRYAVQDESRGVKRSHEATA